MRFLLRLLLNGLAIIVAAWFVPGVRLAGLGPAIFDLKAAFSQHTEFVTQIQAWIKDPNGAAKRAGLFIFVVNAICFALTAALVPGFDLSGFFAAFFGALVVTMVSWLLNALLADNSDRRR